MQAKLVSIQDGTALPRQVYLALSTAASGPQQQTVLDACDPRSSGVTLGLFDGSNVVSADPAHWGNPSIARAHQWLIDHFAEIDDGALIDVATLPAQG